MGRSVGRERRGPDRCPAGPRPRPLRGRGGRAARARVRARLGKRLGLAEPFAHSLRVRFQERDPQGVEFNAHYLAYLDIGMTQLPRAALGSYQATLDRGSDMVVI